MKEIQKLKNSSLLYARIDVSINILFVGLGSLVKSLKFHLQGIKSFNRITRLRQLLCTRNKCRSHNTTEYNIFYNFKMTNFKIRCFKLWNTDFLHGILEIYTFKNKKHSHRLRDNDLWRSLSLTTSNDISNTQVEGCFQVIRTQHKRELRKTTLSEQKVTLLQENEMKIKIVTNSWSITLFKTYF